MNDQNDRAPDNSRETPVAEGASGLDPDPEQPPSCSGAGEGPNARTSASLGSQTNCVTEPAGNRTDRAGSEAERDLPWRAPGGVIGGATALADGARSMTTEQLISLDIIEESGDWTAVPDAATLALAAAAALSRHPDLQDDLPAGASLSLSGNEKLRQLNKAYRGKDRPTNVLSFPVSQQFCEGDGPFLGDIIISSQMVADEARAQNKAPADHFQHLVLHGLLHLLGFDHETEEDAIEMEALEIAILESLGIENPYDDKHGAPLARK